MAVKKSTVSHEQGIRVRVTASPQAAIFLTPMLADMAGRGVEIRQARGGLWSLEAWLPQKRWTPKAERRLRDLCKRLSPHFSMPLSPDFQWEVQERPRRLPKGEKRFFCPFQATELLWVAPPRGKAQPQRGPQALVMEVGRAPGTGIHPSTRTCLRLMEALLARERPARALDVGTGTGILALAAARMGVEHVLAIDVDPHAVRMARRNARRNDLAHHIAVRCRDVAQEGGQYPLVLANLSQRALMRRAKALMHCVAHGGWLILGGIWWRRTQEVLDRFKLQLKVTRTEREAWWVGVVLSREQRAADPMRVEDLAIATDPDRPSAPRTQRTR